MQALCENGLPLHQQTTIFADRNLVTQNEELRRQNEQLKLTVSNLNGQIRALTNDLAETNTQLGELRTKINDLNQNARRRENLVKSADLISLYAYYLCRFVCLSHPLQRTLGQFCEQYNVLMAKFEDSEITPEEFHTKIQSLATQYNFDKTIPFTQIMNLKD